MLPGMSIPTLEPTTLRAGDNVAWQRELPDYSTVDGWSLTYRLIWRTGTAVNLTPTGSGTTYTVSLLGADTQGWIAGPATLLAWVTRGSGVSEERITLASSAVTVLPNLVTAVTHDGRSAVRIGLDNARSALNSYMEKGQIHVAEYEIAGRRMKFRSADEIRSLIEYYEAEVGKENAALAVLTGGSPGRVVSRF